MRGWVPPRKDRQDSIRTMTGGKLKEDVFEDDRFQDPRLKSSLR